MPLTPKQGAILDYLRQRKAGGDPVPSLREIQAHFGFASPFAVTRHLMALEKKGLLHRSGGQARSLTLEEDLPASILRLPILGTIPAGFPSDQREEPAGHVNVDAHVLGIAQSSHLFALKVQGDSMKNAGIYDGDLAIIEPREPRRRDIVAALIDGECTLKRYLVEGGRPFLHAENENYPDLIPIQDMVVQGVCRAIIRTMPGAQGKRHHGGT